MQTDPIIRCPHCGSAAERHKYTSSDPTYAKGLQHQENQAKYPVCAYSMVMFPFPGNVIESYVPRNLFKASQGV